MINSISILKLFLSIFCYLYFTLLRNLSKTVVGIAYFVNQLRGFLKSQFSSIFHFSFNYVSKHLNFFILILSIISSSPSDYDSKKMFNSKKFYGSFSLWKVLTNEQPILFWKEVRSYFLTILSGENNEKDRKNCRHSYGVLYYLKSRRNSSNVKAKSQKNS